MFTGIVEEVGILKKIVWGAHSAALTIQAKRVLSDAAVGDSIAVNGICLTVTSLETTAFTADVKNETDTELARNRALTLSCDEIVFLGATGGRIDHMIGNIHALKTCMERGIAAYIVDSQNRLSLLDGERTFSKAEQWGKYVSFAPYTEEVTGITLTGFKYPLKNKTIYRGEEVGLCISNEIAEDTATITLEDGVLICIESRD